MEADVADRLGDVHGAELLLEQVQRHPRPREMDARGMAVIVDCVVMHSGEPAGPPVLRLRGAPRDLEDEIQAASSRLLTVHLHRLLHRLGG